MGLLVRRHQSHAHGIAHQSGNIVDGELLHHLPAIGVNGFRTDDQMFRDLSATIAFGEQLQDLALAGGEVLERRRCALLARRIVHGDQAGHGRREIDFPRVTAWSARSSSASLEFFRR